MNSKPDISLILRTKLYTANEYIKLERGHRLAAAKVKKKLTTSIAREVLSQTRFMFDKKIRVDVFFHTSRNIDDDNLFFGAKFVLDGMKQSGLIRQDSPKWVTYVPHRVQGDKDYTEVECRLI